MDTMVAVAELAEELQSLRVQYVDPAWGDDCPVEPGDTYTWGSIVPTGVIFDADDMRGMGVVLIDSAHRSDYGNSSTYTRSNLEALQNDYPDTFLVIGYSSHDGMTLALPLDAQIPEHLADILRGLEDYPVYDEQHMAGLEQEIESEAWDSWVQWDLTRELESWFERTPQLACSWEVAEHSWAEMDQRETFHKALSFTNTYPEFETSESCHYDLANVVGEVGVQILKHRESVLMSSFV